MRDLNFFSIYQTNVKERKSENTAVYILGALVGICIISHLLYLTGSYIYYRNEIKKYDMEINSKATQAQLKEAEAINDEISILEKYDSSLCKVNVEARKIDVITDDLLENISKSVPGDLNFTKWTSKESELVIEGRSKTRTSVAEFEHNLKQYSQFKVIHVDKIEAGEFIGDDYEFKMTCVLKEGE